MFIPWLKWGRWGNHGVEYYIPPIVGISNHNMQSTTLTRVKMLNVIVINMKLLSFHVINLVINNWINYSAVIWWVRILMMPNTCCLCYHDFHWSGTNYGGVEIRHNPGACPMTNQTSHVAFLSASVCLCLSVSLWFHLSLSLPVCVSLYVFLSAFLFLSASVSLCLSRFLSYVSWINTLISTPSAPDSNLLSYVLHLP